MRTDRFTQRATEAIVSAQQLAEGEGHAQLEVAHLLLILAEQPDGVVPALLNRIGVAPGAIALALRAELGKLPKVSGAAHRRKATWWSPRRLSCRTWTTTCAISSSRS